VCSLLIDFPRDANLGFGQDVSTGSLVNLWPGAICRQCLLTILPLCFRFFLRRWLHRHHSRCSRNLCWKPPFGMGGGSGS